MSLTGEIMNNSACFDLDAAQLSEFTAIVKGRAA